MIISYVIEGEEVQSKLLFPSSAACSASLSPIYTEIFKHFEDSLAVCKVTDMPSKVLIRPRVRP